MGYLQRAVVIPTYVLVSDTCIKVDLDAPLTFPGGATEIRSISSMSIGWSTLEHRDGALYVDEVKVDPKDGSTLHPNFLEPLLQHQPTMIPEAWNVVGTCIYFRGVIFGAKNDARPTVVHMTRTHSQWFEGVEISHIKQNEVMK